jgi:hypothetical protein
MVCSIPVSSVSCVVLVCGFGNVGMEGSYYLTSNYIFDGRWVSEDFDYVFWCSTLLHRI